MKIEIKGPIISSNDQIYYDWFDMEATSPKKVSNIIKKANGEDLEVEINSGGGSVFAGSEIYTALKSYTGNVTVKIVGLAASAASVITMAGKKVLMSPTAQMMIHNSSAWTGGDRHDLESGAQMLRSADSTIASAYRLKSGMTQEELLAMMDKETWMTPKQALEYKLIDEIMFEEEIQAVASVNNTMLPPRVIDKIRNELKKEPEEKPESEEPTDDKKVKEIENKLKEVDLILTLR